jgi:hypothetical protein
MKHTRGKAFAFNYRVDRDKWFFQGGPELGIVVVDIWVGLAKGDHRSAI